MIELSSIEFYLFTIEAILIGSIAGILIMGLTKYGFTVWDWLFNKYLDLSERFRYMQIPDKIDSAFLFGAFLIFVSIWTEETKFLYTGIWLMGMSLFLYYGRNEG